jgi:hypothetical protein
VLRNGKRHVVTLPSNASEQGGFAVGVSGVKITRIQAPGNLGTFSTRSLPAHTTAAWLLTSAAVPGSSVSMTLAASGRGTGSITVVPGSTTSNGAPTTYFDPISCDVSQVTIPSGRFTVNPHVPYDSAVGGWHLSVTISGAGVVSALEAEPTVGTTTSKQLTAKPLVQSRSQGLKSRGTVTLTLRPTSLGLAALKAHGSIKVKLNVAFSPKDGKSTPKLVTLTLKK